MRTEIFEHLYDTEEKYWWFKGQRYLIDLYLRKYYGAALKKSTGKSRLKLLDVGCGTGITLNLLNRYGQAHGIDVADDAIAFCKKRKQKNVTKNNVMNLSFKDNTFDVITSLGVFYHKGVSDDRKALKELYRVLKPGGRLLFFDCAMMCLYSKHDEAFDGIRRYSTSELSSKFSKAGFSIEKMSYVNSILFPAIYLHRWWSRVTNAPVKSDVDGTINPLINGFLDRMYKTELYVNQTLPYPFGVNIFAIGRKPLGKKSANRRK